MNIKYNGEVFMRTGSILNMTNIVLKDIYLNSDTIFRLKGELNMNDLYKYRISVYADCDQDK